MRPVRIRALKRAKTYVGVKEHPSGSNRGLHIDRWNQWATQERFPPKGITGFPWCASFVCGMFREIGYVVPLPLRASVGYLELWAAGIGKVLKLGVRPRSGDLVVYRFDSDNWPDHIGFVDKVLAVKWTGGRFIGTIRTVEGNTSAGNDANGGQVQVRYRSALRCTFIRIDVNNLKKVEGF